MGNIEIATLLLKGGADPNAKTAIGNKGPYTAPRTMVMPCRTSRPNGAVEAEMVMLTLHLEES